MRPDRAGSSIGGRSSCSQSISSDVSSLQSHALLSPPASVNPPPAYIAVSAASQLVSSEIDIDGASISPDALAQLNSFLDNILFNILLAARSTKLSSLRPAIYNVLKPKLGRSALSGADEELKEYLGDDEDEDEDFETSREQEARQEFDLELAWKLARLRCMVYSRLGDLEEDDEDEYIERENLDERGGRPRRFSSHPSRVPTASAIFLTSVIEYLAEQALAHAARATQRKLSRSRANQGIPEPTASIPVIHDRIMVTSADMRQLGRDSPLQKLWRGWRHQVRLPTDPASPTTSPGSSIINQHGRKASTGTSDSVPRPDLQLQSSVAEVLDEDDPARIPLPMGENDIAEIEAPGLSFAYQKEHIGLTNRSPRHDTSGRPRSLELSPSEISPPAPTLSGDDLKSPEPVSARPAMERIRSRSLPTTHTVSSPGTSSTTAAHDWDSAPAPIEYRQARGTRVGRDPVRGTSQQDTQTSYSLNEGESESANPPDSIVVMPGTFPVVQTQGGKEALGGNGSIRHESDVLLNSPTDSLHKSVFDHGGGLTPATAPSTHGLTTLAPMIRNETLPPRTSSKTAGNSVLHNQPYSSAQLDKLTSASRAVSGQSGAPPLPPVQEMTGIAPHTPEDIFLDTLPTEAQKRQGQVMTPLELGDIRSRTSSKSSRHTKSSSSSSKLLGFERDQQSTVQAGFDRAAIQRIYPIPDVQEVNGQVTRSSTSQSTKDKRPSTASSHVPSLKQASLGRASLDTAVGNTQSQMHGIDQDEKKQDLEKLVRNEETLRYKPQAMREKESFDLPRPDTQTRESSECSTDAVPPRLVKPEEAEKKRHSLVGGMDGLRANPPESVAIAPAAPTPIGVSWPASIEEQSPHSPVARSIRSQHRPRDPKVEKSSVRDLADFAKSTGPEDAEQLPKAVSAVSAQPRRTKSSASRFQARDPVVKGASSDLIDFIREGPPRAKGDGMHRIPRTVAPFRTTMDSDELNSIGPTPQDLAGSASGWSNQNDSVVTKSSANSRTGLIDMTNRTAHDPSNSSNIGASRLTKPNTAEPTQPRRKERRVRDPYAVDNGSDGEIDEGVGRPPEYEEESLVDFLRNTSPPPESQFQPHPLLLSKNYMAAQGINVLKKPVHGGFRERLKRNASTNSLGRSGGPGPSSSPSGQLLTTPRSSTQVRPSSPHLSQSGSRFDSYKPTQATYAAHVERNRQKVAAQGLNGGKEEGGLSKFFMRKRKVAA